MGNNNGLKSIKELENIDFFIPGYQRGYRWQDSEVKSLLNDIEDFYSRKKIKDGDFYCLQPIVVKRKEKSYHVIDGQQRLTTIYLILKYFNDEKNLFTIEYDTRKNSKEFLENIRENIKIQEEVNIDFYHFINAYIIILNYFENLKEKDKFKETLLNQCKVIWYEIEESENENEVFRRLNMGKIPLLPSENIKALFLMHNEELDEDEIKERAEFWYDSEKKLRDEEDFKYLALKKINQKGIMVENKKKYYSDDILRIEVYLEAIAGEKGKELFDYFYDFFKKNQINNKWEEFEEAINILSSFTSKENNQDIRSIFHYIGFLIYCNKSIRNIYKLWLEIKKIPNFAEALRQEVSKEIKRILYKDELDDLSYNKKDDKAKILNLLLLFNLDILIKDNASNHYFKFNKFQLENWNLEHIYAQNAEAVVDAVKNNNIEEIRAWLTEVVDYIEDKGLIEQIKDVCSSDDKLKEIKIKNELMSKINENFKSNEYMHYLGNLCLLDEESNKSFGNKIFSKKRREIEKLAEQDKLIPIATKKVFNKEYSKNKSNPDIFSKNDREEYYDEIEKVIKEYIKGEEND